ncbi:phospho-sugar mutase [Vaginisenegalia massiliensis]|uniref:phospho-sugar mutase n=1 Tax=Vaginisenegalia massiliensis TaxID=2058294 RepID=UPI000F5445D4|nr:phospho-sugar mutase [Vaginisenegalia massiliensis]
MSWQEEYEKWRAYPDLDPKLQNALAEMTDQNEIEEAFAGPLSFGTAGMRGLLGPGLNRMNRYTVRQATEGLAQWICQNGETAKQRGVAIAYDSRHGSADFAMEAALVLGFHGIKSYVYESLRPTPVLSFAVRHLQTYAGIMITASHNPAEYNGYKVYGADGGQMPPEEASQVTAHIRQVTDPLTVQVGNKTELLGSGLIEIIGDRVDQAYLTEMELVTIDRDLNVAMADQVNIVFTPLHGTGGMLGMKALNQAGFDNIHLVETQAKPDGDFPTVKSPNPEVESAFDVAELLAKKVQADIILATDPDADRLGAKVLTSEGQYQLLTGNQLACLMLDYILAAKKAKGELPSHGVVLKSMVSTDLAESICQHYDVEMVEVLTGFKFIAEKIAQYQEDGSREFLMGFEESYGYLIKDFVRDKDAIQALVVLAELTAYYKRKGLNLAQALENLYQTYGYYYEKTISLSFPGLAGQEQMKAIMAQIRQDRLTSFAGIQVQNQLDYWRGLMTTHEGKEISLDYPQADALKYQLEDGSWVAFRPSGTEPKIKLYLGTKDQSMEAVINKAQALEQAVRNLINQD